MGLAAFRCALDELSSMNLEFAWDEARGAA